MYTYTIAVKLINICQKGERTSKNLELLVINESMFSD